MSRRTNQDWLEELRGEHGEKHQELAFQDLSAYLYRVAYNYLISRQTQANPRVLVSLASGELAALAQDFVQETVEKLFRNNFALLDRFQGFFTSWTADIVRNQARQELRKSVWNQESLDQQDHWTQDDNRVAEPLLSSFHDSSLVTEFRDLLRSCIDQLPSRQKEVIIGFYIQNKSVAELSEKLGVNRNVIRVRTHRGKGKLRKCLEEHGYGNSENWPKPLISKPVTLVDQLAWDELEELATKSFGSDISYQVQLSFSADKAMIGRQLEATIELLPAALAKEVGYLLQVPHDKVEGSELNLILDAPGFQLLEEATASLPLMEPSRYTSPQTATFRLIPLRPGTHQVSVELYRGSEYEGQITQTVNVAGIDENVTLSRPLALSPRPVAQPDYVLQVRSRWDEEGSACSFDYHLTSTDASLLLTGGVRAQSKSVSTVQVERLRDSWQVLLGEMASGVARDVRPRLAAFGRYLYEMLVPDMLRQELRMLVGGKQVSSSKRRTLLLITDQEAWLPWELLYDRGKFLAEKVIVGRWLRELGDVPPYEFPVGQVRVAYYERVREEHEWWVDLIEPPGSPQAEALPGGMLENPIETEALRGLHLLRYGEKMGKGEWDAPVLLADADKESTIEDQIQPIKLNLYRNHPLVSLSYVSSGQPHLTNLIEQWAPTFVRAGCSAFVGPLWTVSPAMEVAFISGFYHHLWTGGSLGEAFEAGRALARAANPESLDWLAYVLFGDPMARPYRPVEGMGYAIVEPIGRGVDEPLMVAERALYRVSLRRTPPVWHHERVIEVANRLQFENLQARIATFGLSVSPDSSIPLTRLPSGDYLGWFTLEAPSKMAGSTSQVQVYLVDGWMPIHSLTFELKIESEDVSVS